MKYSLPLVISVIGGHFEYEKYYIANLASCQIYFVTNVFLDPYNVPIDTKIIMFGQLVVEI